ncbi:MAG TPA: dipeptidase [Candidatus Limnocylindrales bacterium]|nr:dipeptidase [Candidatus Limnocylindrales bacterium]
MTLTDTTLEAHLDATRDERLERYKAFLRIPSISGQPGHSDDCRAAATWLADSLREAGAENVALRETTGNPVVYADWLHAGPDAPTVLVYGHYDVQPVDPIDLWHSPPFEPVITRGRMVGRGASDDKGQIHMHVVTLAALLRTRDSLPVNVRYLFEGNEEEDPVHVAGWLTHNVARLAADVAVISDTGFFDGNLPAITIGLRGNAYMQIDVEGPPVDLHSGMYGGTVENPANALAQIIAALKGPDGRIRVPGFYDDVVALTSGDRAAFAAMPFDDDAYRDMIGVPALTGEAGFTTLERRGARPTLDVNGIWGGFEGEGRKTIIPAHAHAKVSTRLVPNQHPHRIFELVKAYIAEIAPPGVRVTVRDLSGGHPSLTPIDHPATQAAARALKATFGRDPLYIREGGSIPVAAEFEETLGLPVVLLGFTPPDDNAHAPNESMELDNYERGIRCIARYWDELATALTADGTSPGGTR